LDELRNTSRRNSLSKTTINPSCDEDTFHDDGLNRKRPRDCYPIYYGNIYKYEKFAREMWSKSKISFASFQKSNP